MAEILHDLGCQPNFEIMGVAGGSIKDAIMHDMAGGAGFQPSTVSPKKFGETLAQPNGSITFQNYTHIQCACPFEESPLVLLADVSQEAVLNVYFKRGWGLWIFVEVFGFIWGVLSKSGCRLFCIWGMSNVIVRLPRPPTYLEGYDHYFYDCIMIRYGIYAYHIIN